MKFNLSQRWFVEINYKSSTTLVPAPWNGNCGTRKTDNPVGGSNSPIAVPEELV